MKRKDIGSAVIDRVDYPNKGHFHIEETGERGIVKNTVPGQKVLFRVFKNKNHCLHGHLLEVLEPSPLETREQLCANFGRCGGCLYQTVPYEKQLEIKEEQVQKLLQPVLEEDTVFDGIKASPREFSYRNKMDYSFGNEEIDGPLTCGIHRIRSRYSVLDGSTCVLAHEDLRKISAEIREYCAENNLPFYNKLKHEGYLRYLMMRRSETTGEILLVLAASTQMTHDFTPLADRLQKLSLEGKIVGFFLADDDRYADALIPDELHCLFGQDYFYEYILGLRFKITLFSFFQTNTKGAEVLYETVRSYVRASSEKEKPVIYDLYCGTGTIAQMLAQEAEKVYGIEIIPEAVEAAKHNAEENQLTNCTFYAGDVFETLPEIPERPDYIILDPPREGVHDKALKKIIDYGITSMVYVSCKASSLVTDMEFLKKNGWRIDRWALVDMFPGTQHVETVCLLSRKDK
ncbi:MAG: 23S rRNA (uracil(1939)-C(5))-methyltransferase RlmD [Lachnospiraceae bacterium]|nr:23S rRNA (uracil(1939)-C(5))-methyltransferase RlmD [Lachnospiraceae bacterium]